MQIYICPAQLCQGEFKYYSILSYYYKYLEFEYLVSRRISISGIHCFVHYTARMIQLIQTIKCQLINIEWWYIHGWRVYTIIDCAFLLRSKNSDLDHPWKLSNYFHTILAAYDEHEQKPHQCDDPKIFEQMIHAVGTKYNYFLTGFSRCSSFDMIIM